MSPASKLPPGERLGIRSGRVGPLVAPCVIEPRPFTVFIGPQGTGKSLAAQLLYLFRDLGRLIPYTEAGLAPDDTEPRSNEAMLKAVLNQLRGQRTYFSSLVADETKVEWVPEHGEEKLHRSITWRKKTEKKKTLIRLSLSNALNQGITEIRQRGTPDWIRAVFVPTERLLYSELNTPIANQVIPAPITYTFFAQFLESASSAFDAWSAGEPDTRQGRDVRERARLALGGEITRQRDRWKWRVASVESRGPLLDLSMASSGQKANWPLVLLAEVLFSWRKEGRVAAGTTIYVEEPEIHLHPAAQRAVIEILAMLVQQGFRVVLTTHSLTVLYTVNNLVQAGRLPAKTKSAGLPPPGARLAIEDVEALVFLRDGTVRSLVNRENGFINESELGAVSSELQDQMNLIVSKLPE
ncbi:MAG: ATP-binding protein [Polyangia bacterium]